MRNSVFLSYVLEQPDVNDPIPFLLIEHMILRLNLFGCSFFFMKGSLGNDQCLNLLFILLEPIFFYLPFREFFKYPRKNFLKVSDLIRNSSQEAFTLGFHLRSFVWQGRRPPFSYFSLFMLAE